MNHNLDIQTYSFKDILDLFDLNEKELITIEDIQHAKKVVFKLHPDKSKLSANYFLFYKKALDLVVEFYKEQNKINQEIPTEKFMYNPKHEKTEDLNERQIKKTISKMDSEKFQETFNKLFDSNMKTNHDTPEKNRWKQDNNYDIPNMTKSTMNENFNKMKQQQHNQHLIVYKGVQELHSTGGNNFYEDDEEDASNYITSDPFSKLQFDDLRKVHNDESIFSVSEKDFDKVTKYKSFNELRQTRNNHNLTPIDNPEALLDLREKQMRENMMKKEYKSKLQTMKFDEKRKTVLSTFLLLK